MLAGIWTYVRHHHLAFLALFIALGGTAWAIEANSVKSKHIVNGGVKAKDLGIGGKFTEVTGLPGAAGGCNAGTGDVWGHFTIGNVFAAMSYSRDPTGIVHLRGIGIRCNAASTTIFTLPEGYRPVDDLIQPATHSTGPGSVEIDNNGEVTANAAQNQWVSLSGVSFPCFPSGVDGCP